MRSLTCPLILIPSGRTLRLFGLHRQTEKSLVKVSPGALFQHEVLLLTQLYRGSVRLQQSFPRTQRGRCARVLEAALGADPLVQGPNLPQLNLVMMAAPSEFGFYRFPLSALSWWQVVAAICGQLR